jgi:hypothetical protein
LATQPGALRHAVKECLGILEPEAAKPSSRAHCLATLEMAVAGHSKSVAIGKWLRKCTTAKLRNFCGDELAWAEALTAQLRSDDTVLALAEAEAEIAAETLGRNTRVYSRFAHRRSRVAARGSRIPPHAKRVGHMEVVETVSGHEELVRYTEDANIYRMCCAAPDKYQGMPSHAVCTADLRQYLEYGYVRRIDPAKVKRTAIAFFVIEERNGLERRRLIVWPKQLNDELPYSSAGFSTANVWENTEDVYVGSHAVVFDLAMGFNQVPIADEVMPYYAFVVDGVYYVSTVMVMGARPSPEVLHRIVENLRDIALARCGDRLRSQFVTKVNVDGVRFVGSLADATLFGQVFADLCNERKVTLKDEPELNNPHTQGEWCGVVYDFTAKTVRMKDSFVAKLRDTLANLGDAMSIADIQHVYGLLNHGSPIVRAPTHRFYAFDKLARRAMAALASGSKKSTDQVDLWSCAREALVVWLSFLIENTPTRPLRTGSAPKASTHLFTDASLKGWGAVIMFEGRVVSTGGRWDEGETRSINELEAQAVINGANAFAHLIAGRSIRLIVDNTSVEYGMQRGSAKSGALNSLIGAALRRLGLAKPLSIMVGYIVSELNPADDPSRGRKLRAVLIRLLLENIDSMFEQTREINTEVPLECANGGQTVPDDIPVDEFVFDHASKQSVVEVYNPCLVEAQC